jgi:hypothetical protein
MYFNPKIGEPTWRSVTDEHGPEKPHFSQKTREMGHPKP